MKKINLNDIVVQVKKFKTNIFNRESSMVSSSVKEPSPVSLQSIIFNEWKWWLSGAIFSFVLASVLMSGWPTGLLPNLDYPITYRNDSAFGVTQRLIEGWVSNNPRSGYPFASNSLDYPNSDFGNFIVLKFIGSFTGNWYSAFNLYYLVGFVFVFVVSFCVLRSIGLIIPFAFTAAMIFNFLPFHFLRIPHLFYTWYFVVPIFWYIALKIYSSRLSDTKINPTLFRKILYAACLMSLGSFGVYYAVFGLIIFSFVLILAIIEKYNINTIKLFLFSSSLIIFSVFLNLFPTLIYQHTNGLNAEAIQRPIAGAEVYGFKFVQLILPRIDHRIKNLANIYTNYSNETPLVNENKTSSLGIIGSIGLIISLCLIFFNLSSGPKKSVIRVVSLSVLVLFMFGTIGGFGSIFSQIITSSIRGWNRVSIFIGFGSLLVFFLLLQSYLQKRFIGKFFIIVASVISAAILLIGLYDQTIPACKTCNKKIQKSFNMEREFIGSIEKYLPVGSAIYQLPYMPFPEAGSLFRLQDYDLSAGFLYSSSLHWSYMGIKGRDGDLFYRALAKESIEKQLEIINKLGFAGIYIDKRGFEDDGKALINSLTDLLGAPPTLTRADNEVVFFSLNQKNNINLEGLDAEQIMQKAGFVDGHFGVRYDATFSEGIDFTRPDLPRFVRGIHGLSTLELWGRWSDANLAPSVRINLQEQLPNNFNLVFIAQPFGPNAGQDLKVKIGTQIHYFNLKEGSFEYRKPIDLGGEKIYYIEFISPQPTSSKQLNLSEDTRKIGIGLVHLSFEEK